MERHLPEVNADRSDVHAMILRCMLLLKSSHLRDDRGGGPSH
jgi:hypothetical protein